MSRVAAVVHASHCFWFETDRPWYAMDLRERRDAVLAETDRRGIECVETFHALAMNETDHPETTWVRGTEVPWCASGFASREDSVRAALSRDLDSQMRFDEWGSYGDRLGVVSAMYERCLHMRQTIQAAVNSGRMSVRDIEALKDLVDAVDHYMDLYEDMI